MLKYKSKNSCPSLVLNSISRCGIIMLLVFLTFPSWATVFPFSNKFSIPSSFKYSSSFLVYRNWWLSMLFLASLLLSLCPTHVAHCLKCMNFLVTWWILHLQLTCYKCMLFFCFFRNFVADATWICVYISVSTWCFLITLSKLRLSRSPTFQGFEEAGSILASSPCVCCGTWKHGTRLVL